jgi:dTDP-4-dehydrorhamnose reductase
MKVLILGVGGMLGHKLAQMLRDRHQIVGTLRQAAASRRCSDLLSGVTLVGGVNALDSDALLRVMADVRPDYLVNCVGIIKQLKTAHDPLLSIATNALLPHRLAGLCAASRCRLIHLSTDCVFSGRKGMYTEADESDAEDLYGRSKFLGEVSGPHCLTLRTSIIGREIESRVGLVEWFLRPDHQQVSGYRRAIYSGFTTQELARIIDTVMTRRPDLNGVYHVSSAPIDKLQLLHLLRSAYGVSTEIVPADAPVVDRSLDSRRFRSELGYQPPSWVSMIDELAADPTPYHRA